MDNWWQKTNIKDSILDWLIFLFVLTLPLSVFWPVGKSINEDILEIYVTPGIFITDIVVFPVVIFFFLFNLRKVKSQRLFFRKYQSIYLPVGLIVLFAFITSIFALSVKLAFYYSFRWLMAYGLLIVLMLVANSTKKIIYFLLFGLTLQALVGVLQVISKSPLNLPGELALDPNAFRAAILAINNQIFLRAYGLTFHPNVLGGFLCVGLILAIPYLNKNFIKLVWWILFIGLILSFSRSAWLAFCVTFLPLCFIVFFKFPKLKHSLIITLIPTAIILLIGGIFLFNFVLARLIPSMNYSEMTSILGRGQLIFIALDLLREYPITGIGAGNFPIAMLLYKTLDPPHYVHNIPLLLSSEIGIIGGLIWLWLWIQPITKIQSEIKNYNFVSVIFLSAWFAWGVISLWDSYPWALESGRLFSVLLLSWIAKECTS